jgi:O-antigen ligase
MLAFKELSEKAFVVLSLLLFTGAVAGFIAKENPLMSIINIFIHTGHLVTLMLIIQRWKTVLAIVIKEQLLWILVGMSCASVLWSNLPMVTLENILPLLRVTIFAAYFAARFSIKEQLELLACAFGISALLSLLVCVAVPKYGVVGAGLIVGQEELVHAGAWRGLYNHKTALGTMMSLGSLILLFCGLGKFQYQYRRMIWAGFFLSVFMLLSSTTMAALLILIIAIILIFFCRLERINFGFFIAMLLGNTLIGSFIVTALVSNAETIFNSLGKEVTISGRTLVWPLVLEKIWKRPWLGYGYETFWEDGWEGNPADIWENLIAGFEPPHAHNGFLEIWLEIGLLGLTVFVICYLITCLRSFIWLHKNRTIEGIAPTILLIYILLLNLTESSLMRSDIIWLIFVSIILSMHHKYRYKSYLIYLDKPYSSS